MLNDTQWTRQLNPNRNQSMNSWTHRVNDNTHIKLGLLLPKAQHMSHCTCGGLRSIQPLHQPVQGGGELGTAAAVAPDQRGWGGTHARWRTLATRLTTNDAESTGLYIALTICRNHYGEKCRDYLCLANVMNAQWYVQMQTYLWIQVLHFAQITVILRQSLFLFWILIRITCHNS